MYEIKRALIYTTCATLFLSVYGCSKKEAQYLNERDKSSQGEVRIEVQMGDTHIHAPNLSNLEDMINKTDAKSKKKN